jgi:hypothetical protein
MSVSPWEEAEQLEPEIIEKTVVVEVRPAEP